MYRTKPKNLLAGVEHQRIWFDLTSAGWVEESRKICWKSTYTNVICECASSSASKYFLRVFFFTKQVFVLQYQSPRTTART